MKVLLPQALKMLVLCGIVTVIFNYESRLYPFPVDPTTVALAVYQGWFFIAIVCVEPETGRGQRIWFWTWLGYFAISYGITIVPHLHRDYAAYTAMMNTYHGAIIGLCTGSLLVFAHRASFVCKHVADYLCGMDDPTDFNQADLVTWNINS